MPPAVIAAGIGAAGAIGGSVLSGNAQKKAAQQATNATTAANDKAVAAQLQLGQQSLNQNANIYKSNFNLLSPTVSRGNVAGETINALLGLPSAPAMSAPDISGTSAGVTPVPAVQNALSGPSQSQILAMKNDGIPGNSAAALAASRR
jgi:hypothetical protein